MRAARRACRGVLARRREDAREPHAHPRERRTFINQALTLGVPGSARRATATLAVHRGGLGEAWRDGEAGEEALLHRLRQVLERALPAAERRGETRANGRGIVG